MCTAKKEEWKTKNLDTSTKYATAWHVSEH